jgi:excisionase family DNA binding protein
MPATQKRPTPKRGNIPPKPATPIHPMELYTYREAAGHLQMPEREVRDMVSDGRIGYVEINRRQRRIAGRQLFDFIDRRTKGPTK